MATRLIGTAPNQVPTNADLGDLAFQAADSVNILGGAATLSALTITNADEFIVDAPSRPATAPTIYMDFINSKSVDTRITFTRSTTAYTINNLGYLEFADIDVPRITFNPTTLECEGLHIENATTNLLVYSEDLSQAAWVKTNSTATSTAVTTPTKGTSAYKVTETAVTGEHEVSQNYTFTSGNTYVFSVFVKAAERNQVQLRLPAAAFGSNQVVMFDISVPIYPAAAISSGAPEYSITAYRNGWYRLTISAAATASVASSVEVLLSSGNVISYLGVEGSGLYVWGAQLETYGTSTVINATSYVYSGATQGTRARDVATIQGTDFTNVFNSEEGCFFFEGKLPTPNGSEQIYHVGDSSTGYLSKLWWTTDSALSLQSNNVTVPTAVGTISKNTLFRHAASYTSLTLNTNSVLNGETVVNNPFTSFPSNTYNVIRFGVAEDGTGEGNIYIRKFLYFPKAQNSTDLIPLTRI